MILWFFFAEKSFSLFLSLQTVTEGEGFQAEPWNPLLLDCD